MSITPAPARALEFAPPGGYSFEPELTGPAPRALDPSLNEGPYASESRRSVVRLFLFGLICFVLPYVPGVRTLAYYLLPLGYLDWIGIAALVIAAGAGLHLALRLGPFKYVRHGQPLIARITHFDVEPHSFAQGSYCYKAVLLYRHPETGALAHTIVRSKAVAPIAQHKYAPRLDVGDYATAVYIPGKDVESSLRLYAFLDVSPRTNIRAGQDAGSAASQALYIVAVFALAFVLLGSVYAIERYAPLDAPPLPIALAAATGGLVMAAIFVAHARWQNESRAFRQLLGPAIVGLFVGGMGGGGGSLLLNAWLDRGPARTVPAEIVEFWTTTYNFVFRSYSIEYRLDNYPKSEKLLTTLEHMHEFRGPEAVVKIKPGAFGWEWVESIEPAPEARAR